MDFYDRGYVAMMIVTERGLIVFRVRFVRCLESTVSNIF